MKTQNTQTKTINEKVIKTKITYYKFYISNPTERKEYNTLRQNLLNKGLKLFDCISLKSYDEKRNFFDLIKELGKKGSVELETDFIFNNQWNTSENSFNLRVFDWYEEIYPNKKIKEGYYLELTNEMIEIRENTFHCGFCGKQYFNTKKKFCFDCLGSEYLKKENLPLLRLKRVSKEDNREDLNKEEMEFLLKLYEIKQEKGTKKRNIQKIKDLKNRFKKDLTDAKNEYKGFMWLLKNGVNTKNCIYYSHTGLFCFGWRKELSFEEEQNLKIKLKGFPFEYEFKTQ